MSRLDKDYEATLSGLTVRIRVGVVFREMNN
jgi:hypothetical protein